MAGKYEREVNNHATKIKEAAALQSIVDKSKREAHLAREALGAIEKKMREEKVSASTEALGKKKEAGEIAARLKQLESHNELLHAQLDLRLDSLQSTSQQDKGVLLHAVCCVFFTPREFITTPVILGTDTVLIACFSDNDTELFTCCWLS